MPKRKKLTIKQRQFAEGMVEHRNGTEAALEVYNAKNRSSAANIASHLNQNPLVQAEIEHILAQREITRDSVAQKLNEGANARVVVLKDGEAIETSVPDHNIRHKYVKDQAEMLEMFPSKKIETRNLNVDIELEKMSPAQIQALLQGLMKTYGKTQEQLPPDSGPAQDAAEAEG